MEEESLKSKETTIEEKKIQLNSIVLSNEDLDNKFEKLIAFFYENEIENIKDFFKENKDINIFHITDKKCFSCI